MYGSLKEVEAGAKRLAQVILGASHLAQSVIPKLLTPTEDMINWRSTVRLMLEKQSIFICTRLDDCPGLEVVPPQGSMYAIVKIDITMFNGDDDNNTIKDDMDFSMKLLEEENVFVLPGSAFGAANVFRIVFCPNETTLDAAATRIKHFCTRHTKNAQARKVN